MKMRSINLGEFPDFAEPGAYPTSCVVEMSVEEALYLSRLLGRLNDFDKEAILRGGTELDIWGCLNGDLFNRFWDEGDRGAARDLGRHPSADAVVAAQERGKLAWRD